ncbi:MAG: ferredoxin--NADP reductase [Gammaproteobacteria bacterium]|jgi:3-ketosteroid 9alpha-monooxygenase subunit B|nr:ferredoxin--NADP reductase [Gammaproteobacteria bacterium]
MNFYPLVVSNITDETSLAKSFTFQIEDKYQSLFQFQAGQFLSLRLPWEESYLDRCYSLSSSPDQAKMTITVKRVKDGRISNLLNDNVKEGDIIDIASPSGRFVPTENQRPLSLFAAGSGITPIMSIIKHTLANTELTVTLFYANSNDQQIIFKQALTELSDQYPERFSCHHHLSSENGRVNETIINHFIDEQLDQDFFICGPGPFMDLTENALRKLGVADQHIFIERFASDAESTLDTEAQLPSDIASFNAILDGESHIVPYLAGKTLLESMLAHDLKPAYFCQKAKCGMCAVMKTAGEVVMRNSDILSDNEKEKGKILLCQSLPLNNDISVDCDAD